MAQRMESVAPPGGVMLSESSARLVENTAVLGEPEMVQIKGADAPVPARRLLGVASQRAGSGALRPPGGASMGNGLVTACWIGRSVATGVWSCVVGPPGIGKSRLVRETAAIARQSWCRGVFDFLRVPCQ